jgi:Gly-Xaa carboxypeptidase
MTILILAFFGTLQCLAAHAPDIPLRLRKDIIRAGGDDKKLAKKAMTRVIRAVREVPKQRYLMGTSQAIDIVNGGVKGIQNVL